MLRSHMKMSRIAVLNTSATRPRPVVGERQNARQKSPSRRRNPRTQTLSFMTSLPATRYHMAHRYGNCSKEGPSHYRRGAGRLLRGLHDWEGTAVHDYLLLSLSACATSASRGTLSQSTRRLSAWSRIWRR